MSEKYQDLEHLLFKGFIPHKLQIGDCSFVLKSINEFEYESILLRSGLKEDRKFILNFHINYLFYSIYMINGTNFLAKREELYADFIDCVNKFPFSLTKKLIDATGVLTKRQNECSKLVEPYSFETKSRYHWEYRKGSSLNSKLHTGISGTENINLNSFQKYWIALNLREDQANSFEEKYSLAKFLASFQDHKSVKKIDAQDKAHKEEEEKRRERVKSGGIENRKIIHHNAADSKDGIIEELEKQMRGEKDEHDLFIEKYEKDLRTEMLRRMKEMKEIREKRSKEIMENMEETRPITPEEMEERIQRVRDRSSNGNAIHYGENETRSKYLQFSNVSDQDVIKESDFMDQEEYGAMMEDPMFEGLSKQSNTENKYQQEQNRLAKDTDQEDKYRGEGIKAYPNKGKK